MDLYDLRNYLVAHSEASVHDLNQRLWRFLNRKPSCEALFESTDKLVFMKRQRKEIYYWVMD